MTAKCIPINEEHEIMEAIWMQIKGLCEKPEENTDATELHVAKMLQEMAKFFYSK